MNVTPLMGSQPKFNPAELTQENNLWAVWCKIRHIPESRANNRITILFLILMASYALLTTETTEALSGRVREWCDFGLTFAGSLLGFLIAGFTIFATLSKPNLFLEMAKRIETKSGLSYLKSSLFLFLKTFIIFTAFVLICLLVKFFVAHGGAIPLLSAYLFHDKVTHDTISHNLAEVGIVFIGTFFFYLIMLLQSFIFNVYHAIMMSIRWEAESEARL